MFGKKKKSMEDMNKETTQAHGHAKHDEHEKHNRHSDPGETAAGEEMAAEAPEGAEEEKLKELQDKYLRLYSDFENYRKRVNKERIELIQNANKDLLLELLPVYDDFERAVDSIGKIEDVNAVLDGFKFIFNKFQRVMNQSGLKEIEAVGAGFDPEYHEAITKIPAPTPDMKGKVVDQVQKGYTLNDKIIRHSKVVVGE